MIPYPMFPEGTRLRFCGRVGDAWPMALVFPSGDLLIKTPEFDQWHPVSIVRDDGDDGPLLFTADEVYGQIIYEQLALEKRLTALYEERDRVREATHATHKLGLDVDTPEDKPGWWVLQQLKAAALERFNKLVAEGASEPEIEAAFREAYAS